MIGADMNTTHTTTQGAPTMSTMSTIGIIRDPQPNDVIVFTVPANTTTVMCDEIGKAARAELDCRVFVVSDGIRIGDDGAAAELAALKARRCGGCAHAVDAFLGDVDCDLFGQWFNADHACNAWTPKEPTT